MFMITEISSIKIYRGRIEGVADIFNQIKPKLQKLWDQPDSILPPWIVDGTVYATFPRHQEMDSNGLIQNWPEMLPIMKEIYCMINDYYTEMNFDTAYEPYVDAMWANCYTPGSTGLSHNHPEMIISGGFYFDCTAGQGNIIIEPPSADHSELEVVTGDVILWPGWLNHTIKKNTFNYNRVSVGLMVKARLK
jgi:hypothetical protein